MSNNSINTILRDGYQPELPYGFAERVANAVMEEGRSSVWDLLLGFSPRVSIALGTLAVALMVAVYTGDGPSISDAVANYATAESIIPLP
jgi:hypothetical protein